MVAAVPRVKQEPMEDDNVDGIIQSEEGLVLNTTAEFCRNIGEEEEDNKHRRGGGNDDKMVIQQSILEEIDDKEIEEEEEEEEMMVHTKGNAMYMYYRCIKIIKHVLYMYSCIY